MPKAPKNTVDVEDIPIEQLTVADILNPARTVGEDELKRLAQLSPFRKLPRFAVAKRRQRLQPPILYCGWFINIEDFRMKAIARKTGQVQTTNRELRRPVSVQSSCTTDSTAVDHDEDTKTRLQRQLAQEADDYDMCKELAQEVMEELGFPIPMGYYVVAALGTTPGVPRSYIRLGFALYNNYYPNHRPSEEDIQRVRDYFGFKGEPMWFMDSLETYWSD